MKFYRVLIRLLRVVNELYFIEIRSIGRHRVPVSGPVILAANHPSSILDSILLATQLRRPINYLARSGLFRFPVLARIFRLLGAIPIYRADEVADAQARNAIVFDQVHDLLDQGGCVGVFPEGRNSPPTRIGPLRKGAARMALGAEARNDFRLGLVLVPVGVNFENRGFLSSAVLLRFGAPIRIADFAEAYRADPDRACTELTTAIRDGLGGQVLEFEDERLEHLVNDLTEVFGETLGQRFADVDSDGQAAEPRQRAVKRWLWQVAAWYRRTTPEKSRAFERRMLSRRHIKDVLARAWQTQPRRVVALRNRLERYKDHLRQTELRGALSQAFDEPVRQRLIRLRMTLYAVGMAPLALFGLAHNIVPYALTRLAGRLNRDEAVRAFTLFGVGLLSFGMTYGLLALALWRWSELDPAWIVAYLLALPPTGFVALRYRRNVLIYRDSILVRTIFWNRRELIDLLRRERAHLVADFAALAERYPSP